MTPARKQHLQLAAWLRNPWSKCDNMERGPIPEWQGALMFEAANVIEAYAQPIPDRPVEQLSAPRQLPEVAALAELSGIMHDMICLPDSASIAVAREWAKTAQEKIAVLRATT